jgi:hypothetical protein
MSGVISTVKKYLSSYKPKKNYKAKFKLLIDNYKTKILTINNDYTNINEYLLKYFKIVKKNIADSSFKSTVLDDAFFFKSSIILLSNFNDYTPLNNGTLIANSSNCSFTIAYINSKKMFIKVVDYYGQETQDSDLLIFDVIAYIIFEKILSLPENQKYKDFIPKYIGTFASYTRRNIWNYNEFSLDNSLSPYYELNIIDGTSVYYKKDNRSLIAITEAINNPYSILQIFQEDNDLLLMQEVLLKTYELYEFIKYLGVEYGFMHNDLHMGNVLYNSDIKKLVLIDFGRVSFYKYIKYKDDELHEKIISEFKKLNYNIAFDYSDSDIDNYTKLYSIDEYLYQHNLSIGDNGSYFGVIYDLITFSMNIYVRTIYHLKKVLDEPDYDKFINNFSKIISINFTSLTNLKERKFTISTTSTLDELITNFVDVRDNFITTLLSINAKNHLTYILEGLLYTSLLLHYKKLNNSALDIRRNRLFYVHFQVLINELPEFLEYIKTNLINYRTELSSDSFISLFIPSSGGKKYIKPIKQPKIMQTNKFSLFNIKSNTNSKPKELTLNETAEAYRKLINIERQLLE